MKFIDLVKSSEQNGFLDFRQFAFFGNAVTLPSGLNSKIEDQQIVANILKFNHSKYKINLFTYLGDMSKTDSHVKRYPEELP